MTRSDIRWGIIGLGRIAAAFAGALAGTRGSVLSAVCSRQSDKAERFAAAAGNGAQSFCDVDTMLKAGEIDAVYIASPNALHREHALLAISAGKAVLCEKPLAAGADEAREIAEAARNAGVFCMEAMWTRFLPAVTEAKRLVHEGAIGRPHALLGDLSFPQPFHTDSRFYSPALGGGVLLDLGIYPLSLAIHFMGVPRSWASTGVLAPTGVEQRAALTLGYVDATATLSCGFDIEGPNEFIIAGEGGFIRLHAPMHQPSALTVRRSLRQLPRTEVEHLPEPALRGQAASLKAALRPFDPRRGRIIVKPYRGNGLGHQIDEVQRCLAIGLLESPAMPLADSIAALDIIDNVRKAMRP